MNPAASDPALLPMGRVRLGLALAFLSYFCLQGAIATIMTSRQESDGPIFTVVMWSIAVWRTFYGGRFSLWLMRAFAVLTAAAHAFLIILILGSALMGRIPAAPLFAWHELTPVLVKVAGLTYIIWALFLARDVQAYLADARRRADLRKLARTTTP